MIVNADMLAHLPTLPAECVEAIVTDPPYDLTSGKKGGSGVASIDLSTPFGRARIGVGNGPGGFMGLAWDSTGIAFDQKTWAECLRVAVPGAHLLAFGGTRTYHRMTCAIEDAGWEIQDCIFCWLYGTGLPKAQPQKALLKPACEPCVVAMKPLIGTYAENRAAHGTGSLNIDACRIASGTEHFRKTVEGRSGGMVGTADVRDDAGQGMFAEGSAFEPTNDARGRWPANVIFDERSAADLDAQTGTLTSGSMKAGTKAGRKGAIYSPDAGRPLTEDIVGSSGAASRFFYVAKPGKVERLVVDGTQHPTQKPLDLMRYLVRLVCPKGGVVLDPFMGSGTTCLAAELEGFDCYGIERDPRYFEIAKARLVSPR